MQNQEKQQKKQFIRSEELPYCDFPTCEEPKAFFKVRQHAVADKHTINLGVKVCSFAKFQEDTVCYLGQSLMAACNDLKVFLIEPNHVYFQMNLMIDQDTQELQTEQILLEGQIMKVLSFAVDSFKTFYESYLNEKYLLSQEFEYQSILDKFEKEVTAPVNKLYRVTFSR